MEIRIPWNYARIVMDATKRMPVIKGHLIASVMKRPYVRLCADVAVEHPFTYDAVRRHAFEDKGDAAFMLGEYEDRIRPYVEKYLRDRRFSCSYFEVDGIKQNGATNVALWLARPDIEKLELVDYARCLAAASMVEVLEEVEDWKELETVLSSDVFLSLKQECGLFGRETPPIFRTDYEFGVEGLSIYPKPYRAMPPTVCHFYGAPASEAVLALSRMIRRNPRRFGGAINMAKRTMRGK